MEEYYGYIIILLISLFVIVGSIFLRKLHPSWGAILVDAIKKTKEIVRIIDSTVGVSVSDDTKGRISKIVFEAVEVVGRVEGDLSKDEIKRYVISLSEDLGIKDSNEDIINLIVEIVDRVENLFKNNLLDK